MVLRIALRNDFIFVFSDEFASALLFASESSIGSGMPGVGVRSAPPGNGIAQVEVYPADVTSPPQPNTPAVSAFDNKVEMQWPGLNDDPSGSGLYLYQVYRLEGGTWVQKASLRRPGWVDLDVQPSTTYQYSCPRLITG